MKKLSWTATAACVAALSLELVAVAGWQGWFRARAVPPPIHAQRIQASVSAQPPAAAAPGAVQQAAPAAAAKAKVEDSYYAQLRSKIRWVETRIGGDKLLTPDVHSRMLLAKSAAERAGLDEVGLGFQDVYGMINAETSWVPRTGMGKNGTPSLGIAQFEPATARGLGLRNPNDAVEAVHVAARHMKQAAVWSADRIDDLKLGTGERALKLREGVSIFYNLSTRGRNTWNGRNTHKLPIETRRHISNVRSGAQQAVRIDAQLQASTGARQESQLQASTAVAANGG